MKVTKINTHTNQKIPITNWIWDCLKSIRRSPYLALVAILTITLTMYNLTIVSLQVIGANEVIKYLENKPAISAFFISPPDQESLDLIKDELEQVVELKEFVYVSQEKALEIYKQQNQSEPLLLEMVTANILPASIEVSPANPEDLTRIAEYLNQTETFDDVIYHQDAIDELLKWTRSIRLVGAESVSFLGILSFLVIFMIISMKIAIKRKEINIFQLVGASNWYIKRPFLLESVIYAVIGSILGWVAAYTRLQYATPFLLNLYMFQGRLPEAFELPTMLIILFAEFGVASLWAIIATTWAVNRFLSRST